MKNKGLTLAELVITMVIASIVAMTLTVLFISEFRLREQINDQITVVREAETVIDHVSRVIRFCPNLTAAFEPHRILNNSGSSYYLVWIKGGRLIDSVFTQDPYLYVTVYDYYPYHIYPYPVEWPNVPPGWEDQIVMFRGGSFPNNHPSPFKHIVARYVSNFYIEEDAAMPGGEWLKVFVTARKNDAEITLETSIRRIE